MGDVGVLMTTDISIRSAFVSEKEQLEALQSRASLNNPGLNAMLEQPFAISSAARRRGSAALHVVGNPHAEAFYRACGFELLGTEQTRFGTGLLMRREL